jgi:hypothetical protein
MVRRLDGTAALIDIDDCDSYRRTDFETYPDLPSYPDVADAPAADPPPETCFHRTRDGRWFVDVEEHCYEIKIQALFGWALREELGLGVEILRPDYEKAALNHTASPGAAGAPASDPAPPKPIILAGRDRPIIVVNQSLGPLRSGKGYAVLRAVVDAYPGGLTKEELIEESRSGGAVTVFKGLRESHRSFRLTLVCPGKRGGGGYRCVWPGEWLT